MRPCLSHARRLAGAALAPALLGPALLSTPAAALASAAPAALPVAPAPAAPATLRVAPAPLPAYAVEAPACASPDARNFPLAARLRGGPESYESGGGYGVWYLDLVNSTGRDCAGVHPVVVLVDGRRELKAGQLHLEFYDGERPRAVRFEETDADELVGPFGEGDADGGGEDSGAGEEGAAGSGFAGFSVPAHRTLTVKLRLSFTADAVANDVTAHAAVVQRRGDDGEWVGQSGAYRFTVEGTTGSSSTSTPQGTGARTEEGRELAGTGAGPVVVGAAVFAGGLVAAGAGFVVVRRRRYR
ncbi:hypothetical protein [Streptomyces niveiscabiei]|uniref:Gram-positive cocci surface proteins LPxTG domain-containing protein n=1 Tax=Streptomyces niveiscabiei TaxID=164115 RepID=A0ABW9HSA1_9ACTN